MTTLATCWPAAGRRRCDVRAAWCSDRRSRRVAPSWRCLRHLRDEGFDGAPRPVGDGFAADGREQPQYVDGTSPHPRPWTDDAAWRLGDLLRRLHVATASFTPPVDAVWSPWFARSLSGRHPAIGHGDLGPWNILERVDGTLVAIDWDNAGPVDATWDLAQLVWLNAQLHDDDVAERAGLGPPATRARQAVLMADGYGLHGVDRDRFVDQLLEMALRSAQNEAILATVDPDTVSPAADGFPILWAIAWRTRSAAWILDHATLPRNALGAAR